MKQTLIQTIVAAVALVILAAVVYRAQSTAPSPETAAVPAPITPSKKLILIQDPVFQPSLMPDADARAISDGGREAAGEEEPSAEGEKALVPINITIDDEMFLPSTKMGPLIPARVEANE